MASGGNGNRRGGGFSGFGNFPGDPFANFGMGSRGRSIFDVFDNDPFFNDPFFTRPFGSMFGGQAGGLLGGPQGFLGNGAFNNQQQTAPPAPAGGYLENGPRNPAQYHQQHHQQQRDPIIEELPDSDSDADDQPRSSFRPGQQPIIEHPDDDVRPAEPQERQRPFQSSIVQAGALPVFNNNGGGRSFSFQSSSVSYGGPNGTYYSSSAARRLGPDGGRSITRKRTSEGREQTLETLHNLREEELPNFERNWEDRAKALPQMNRFRPHSFGAPHGNPDDVFGSGSRSRVALPGPSSSQGGRS